MSKIIIAIDGYSSCGKSTLAKQLAKELGYIYIDTGSMYRAVTWYAITNNLFVNDQLLVEELIKNLNKIEVSFSYDAVTGLSSTYLKGKNIEKEIRGMQVSNYVSKIAQIKEVRKKLIAIQRKIGLNKGVVMDGRDIGSVVFPAAELKIFMTADYKIRAQRRFEELTKKGVTISYEEVLKNIELRDNDDSSRTENPLIKAKGAVEIDNSNMNQDEQFKMALDLVKRKLVC